MPPSTSPLAYRDIQACMDRALGNNKGIKIACSDFSEAHSLRQRFYTARKIDRELNCKIFTPDHPNYARSIYDSLIVYPADDNGSPCLIIEVSTEDKLNSRVEDLE